MQAQVNTDAACQYKFPEQLPNEEKDYLVVTNDKDVLIATYYRSDSWDIAQGYCNGDWISDDVSVTVTHWQELH